jgi:hypothetical protein
MSNNDETVTKSITGALSFACIAGKPFVLMTLWRWFVTPLGVPALTYGRAFGLVLLFGVLTVKWEPKLSAEDDLKRASFHAFGLPIALGIGWLALKVFA